MSPPKRLTNDLTQLGYNVRVTGATLDLTGDERLVRVSQARCCPSSPISCDIELTTNA
jgi:hypothetical protein